MPLKTKILFLFLFFFTACKSEKLLTHHNDQAIDFFKRIEESIGPSGQYEKFIFFTDPHLSDVEGDELRECLHDIKYCYDKLQMNFCICGGDWLNSGDSPKDAIFKLSQIDNTCEELFGEDTYLPVLGNHDTNYQGVDEAFNENSGILRQDLIDSVFFNNQIGSFYSYSSLYSTIIVFDTGIDWTTDITEFRWEQLDWFANTLINNKSDNLIIVLHIYTLSNNVKDWKSKLTPFASKIIEIANSFNMREKLCIKDKVYITENTVGKIKLILCGHSHIDYVDIDNTIPVVCTRNTYFLGKYNYDLCLLDYEENVLNMVRIGEGEYRKIPLAM